MNSEHFFARLFENSSEGNSSGTIVGHLPEWFKQQNTQIIYNGPVGIWDHQHQTVQHWFDGLALLTSFKIIQDGTMVQLTKRYLKSLAFEKAKAHGKLLITEYATPGATDMWQR